MDYMQKFQLWKTDSFFDESVRRELILLNNEKEIEDRFYRNLEFGTGGLRGLMGAGTNRINKYTIGRTTMGVGQYLLYKYGEDACENRGVVIGYDTRNNSQYFSKITADVFSSMGIRVYLQINARPTPQLSFSIKANNALAGVVITASHNPKEYNGYKVYDEYGCQLVPVLAEKIIKYIDDITDYHLIKFTGNPYLVQQIDMTDRFVDSILKQGCFSNNAARQNLHIVYTPIHGTGYIPVPQTLQKAGFNQVDIVEDQADLDGNFPTVISPNPEERQSLGQGILLAGHNNADLVIGTDADCDRVGVAVKTADGYELLTGNQVGALLTDFILNNIDLNKYKNPAIIKTVVTSDLGAEIARRKDVSVLSTLTGFKFIGEKITQFEQAKKNHINDQDYNFIFGYEESFGYLFGTHARDKDAVMASLLICEMAAQYKQQGCTLLEQMNKLYTEYGFYHDSLDSFTLKGRAGLAHITEMMIELRKNGSPFENTVKVIDYCTPADADAGFGKLPSSDVLKYILNDDSWIAIRPSGTEPKIKIYYSIKSTNKQAAEKRLSQIRDTIQKKLGLS